MSMSSGPYRRLLDAAALLVLCAAPALSTAVYFGGQSSEERQHTPLLLREFAVVGCAVSGMALASLAVLLLRALRQVRCVATLRLNM